MTHEQAMNILIQTAHLAQKAGALSLKDAPVVAAAVEFLSKKEEPAVDNSTAYEESPN